MRLDAENVDRDFDSQALPTVPSDFEIYEFAREPTVRQPTSMAFDAKGRLFVGMGPQYRKPTPETPGDSVVIVEDADRDGVADHTRVFATGFNAIQGLAWRGNELWIANAPDLTIVRDLNADDMADEYVKLFTDLGNLEHGLHGLNWGPDGKLYMSKGNSKGLTKPGRIAPKPFRDLWGVTAFPGAPDFPEPIVYSQDDYVRAYHDPADDWGLEGGILRCDRDGKNLEIVARGFRNPWDIAFDHQFEWLGTDNDQTMGDRVFMIVDGAHMGWNHPWSAHWTDAPHLPTAPVSGPLFEGSGTGVAFCDVPTFPPEYRNVFLVNDWLRKTTFVWRPEWDGALMRPRGGTWQPFIVGNNSLFRPTDMEFGPDGALWVLGWSSGYGAEYKDGAMINEGRVFRVAAKDRSQTIAQDVKLVRLDSRSLPDLINDLQHPLKVRRIDAQDELIRRGAQAREAIFSRLQDATLSESAQTWLIWTLGRFPVEQNSPTEAWLHALLEPSKPARLNLQIQAIRILAELTRQDRTPPALPRSIIDLLQHPEPRLRLTALQALRRVSQVSSEEAVMALIERETDATVFYTAWKTLQTWSTEEQGRARLKHPRGRVRLAAMLGLLEAHQLSVEEVKQLGSDPYSEIQDLAQLWLEKAGNGLPTANVRGRDLTTPLYPAHPTTEEPSVAYEVVSASKNAYRALANGLREGEKVYTDRHYTIRTVPDSLRGCDFIQTANDDDGSSGDAWLTFQLALPSRVYVAMDHRQKLVPKWLRGKFRPTAQTMVTDDATLQLYVREFKPGKVTLGGNTEDGKSGKKGNYLVILDPLPAIPSPEPVTLEQTLPIADYGDAMRGEILFRHRLGAGCIKCHRVDDAKNGFGPNLKNIGQRATIKHILQSMIDPSAMITQGFQQQVLLTDDGTVFSGVLLEESGLSIGLGLATGDRVDIPKASVESRKSSPISAMPSVASLLTSQAIVDIVAFLTGPAVTTSHSDADSVSDKTGWYVDQKMDRLSIAYSGRELADFVFLDPAIKRPYFCNVRTLDGQQVTRQHPPQAPRDAVDHADMHPGIWLGFGDINGTDFWRNGGTMEHVQFLQTPFVAGENLTFATQSRLLNKSRKPMGDLRQSFSLTAQTQGWVIVWDARFLASQGELIFGDQEEMGLGVRMATELTELHGGKVFTERGLQGAKQAWGQSAAWCDYSGTVNAKRNGISVMADPKNFRPPWWHTRDYGLMVANAFGRHAMKQGEPSRWTVLSDQELRMRYAIFVHSTQSDTELPILTMPWQTLFGDP